MDRIIRPTDTEDGPSSTANTVATTLYTTSLSGFVWPSAVEDGLSSTASIVATTLYTSSPSVLKSLSPSAESVFSTSAITATPKSTFSSTPAISPPPSQTSQNPATPNRPISSDKMYIGIAIGVGIAVLIVIASIAVCMRKQRREKLNVNQNLPEMIGQNAPVLTDELQIFLTPARTKFRASIRELWVDPPELEGCSPVHELWSPDAETL